jgi:hypothetical protein
MYTLPPKARFSSSVGNGLFNSASLDLPFAKTKSLVDATTGANLVDFTRASSGTYVDSEGVIRTATTNIIWPSEVFTTGWGAASATRVADAGIAPNGTLTADRIESTGGGVFRGGVSVASGISCTYSIYIKHVSGTGVISSVGFERFGAVPLAGQTSFNVLTGTVVSNGAAVTASSITPVGDGWYRVSVRATSTDTTTTIINYAAASGNQFLLWGAQLEQSTTVGEYIPTTSTINSAPRFDHDPTTGESLGLLVEEQRTNSITNNTMVGAVAGTPGTLPTNWVTQGGGVGTLTQQVVGTGTQNGINYIDIKYSGTTSTTDLRVAFEPSTEITAALGQSWTTSVYTAVVGGSLSNITTVEHSIVERNAAGGFLAESVQAISATGTLVRGALSRTLNSATVGRINSAIKLAFSSGVAIDITLRIGLPQLEQGAFATSVIPTTTAAATRAADVASISGSNFSGWWNNTAGTMRSQWVGAVNGCRSFHCEDAGRTGTERFAQRISSNFLQTEVASNGILATKSASGAGTVTYPAIITSCAAYDATNCVVAFRGDVSSTATANGSPEPGEMLIGSYRGIATFANGPIARLTYWPARLPDSTLQTITQ